ncbi:MAG: hypothetical protein IJI11_01090 [Mogibacterium sp.]|nr:hypothetical protein [Mogibacterium sp.]
MKTFTTWKRICGILLALALMVPGFALPAYAAGSYTVSGTYDPGVTLEGTTEFKLYSVGTFDRSEDQTKSILVLNPDLKEHFNGKIDLGIQRDDYAEGEAGDKQWTEDWLTQAKTLADWINNYEATADERDYTVESIENPAVATLTGGAFSFGGVENGLYLLTSDSRQKVKGADGTNDSKYYFPRPMLVQVLNGNVVLVVKTGTEDVKDFTVLKAWDDDGKEALRPASVTINLNYGRATNRVVTFSNDQVEVVFKNDEKIDKETYTADGDKTKVTTVDKKGKTTEKTLESKFNGWTYSWETNEVADPWTAVELMDADTASNYYYTTTENVNNDTHQKVITLTNICERYDLRITKNTPKLAKVSDGSNITAVFEIKGYAAGSEEPVYTDHVSAVIDKTQVELVATNVPRNLAKVVVKEVYAGGNYTGAPAEQEAVFVADTVEPAEDTVKAGHYEASFTNTLNEDVDIFSSGIVNKFNEAGKIIEREGKRAAEQVQQ